MTGDGKENEGRKDEENWLNQDWALYLTTHKKKINFDT